MNEDRMQELKEHYLSQNKPEKIAMYEYFAHVKHELRMIAREREYSRNVTQPTT